MMDYQTFTHEANISINKTTKEFITVIENSGPGCSMFTVRKELIDK